MEVKLCNLCSPYILTNMTNKIIFANAFIKVLITNTGEE